MFVSSRTILILVALLLLAACARSNGTSTESSAPRPVATLFPTRAASAPAANDAQPNAEWIAGDSGVEVRHLSVASGGGSPAPVVIVRLDPARVRLHVAYAPSQPKLLNQWFNERKPLLAVNGSFFTPEHRATALLLSDGAASGDSYDGFGGMFAVAGDGQVALWALRDQAYNPAADYVQGMQSFPMLVFPGGVASEPEDNGARARRTAVALDHRGRVLIVVSPTSRFTLREFARWLATSDLDIDCALNLDGGSSTGLFVNAGAAQESIDAFVSLPIVLFAEAKE